MTSKHSRRAKQPAVSLLMLQSREIGAAEFKARCLEIIDEVERMNMEIVITKHRKPVARLLPVSGRESRFCGSLKGMVLQEGDLVSPFDAEWESDEPNLT